MTADRALLAAGALLAALGVVLGAFGAHALRATLDETRLGWWQTGVQYHLWHAVALVALGAVPLGGMRGPAWLLALGIHIFSGSLYVMALTGQRWLGAVTPLGGLCFIAGWLWLAWRALRA